MDITKKIPLVDFSNTYIEVSDLQDLKKYISGDGSAEKSKGNIWFNKSGYDGEYTLLVAEKGNLTENTYKSVLSILEVMFDNDKVIQHFKNNYPNISTGDKEFKGFNIKVNPKEKTQWEENEETNVFLIVLYIIVGTCSIALIALLLTKRKRK